MTALPLDSVPYVSYLLSIGFGPRFVWPILKNGSFPGSLTLFSVLVNVFLRLMLGMPLPLTSKKFVLSHARHSDFHVFVADVVKSFDTVDRDILDCALCRLGLPAWFRRVYFSFS